MGFRVESETAAPTDNRPVSRSRGGADAGPDIIEDRQRVSKRGIFDIGSAKWRRVGAAVKAVAGRGRSSSVRDNVVQQLRERVVDDLDDLAGSPTNGGRMKVATHPADEVAAFLAGSAVTEATQRRVASGRDLQVARWLLATNPELMVAEAQDELRLLRTGITLEEPVSRPGLIQMWKEQIERAEEDLEVFNAMRSRAPHAWERLREPQAAALVVVERRGRQATERDYQATVARLRQDHWARIYAGLDLENLAQTAHEYLRLNGQLTTNMRPRRLDALLADPEGIIRNGWEDGRVASVLSSSFRVAAERNMGYAAIVGEDAEAVTRAVQHARDLPGYAALLSSLRPEGLSRFGPIVFVWKPDVRARSTFTPADSMRWPDVVHGAPSVTGPDHLYPLLAYGHADAVRLVFAEATEFAYDDELRAMLAAGAQTEEYFEGQIHGDLLWSDLDKVRLCHTPDQQDAAAPHRDRIQAYANQRGLDLPVELHLLGNPPITMSPDSHAADRDSSQPSDPWDPSRSEQGAAHPQSGVTSDIARRRADRQAQLEHGSGSNRGRYDEVQGMSW